VGRTLSEPAGALPSVQLVAFRTRLMPESSRGAEAPPTYGFSAIRRWGKRTQSKCGGDLLPFSCLLYSRTISHRTNIAYAKLGMKGDLTLTDLCLAHASEFSLIGYFACRFPAPGWCNAGARGCFWHHFDYLGALTGLTRLSQTPLQLYGRALSVFGAAKPFFSGR